MVKKSLLKILTLALVGMLILTSCGEDEIPDREYDEAEVLEAARELIDDSIILNEIYWGAGIPYIDDANLKDGVYYPADDTYLSKIGVKTLEDLKNLTRGTFSDDQCEWIFSTLMSSVSDGNGIVSLARYGQKWGGENLDVPEYILVNSDATVWLDDTVDYNYDMMAVSDVEGEVITVRLLVTVTNPEGKIMNENIDVKLIEESDGWRLHSPTYVSYYDPF